MHMRRKKWARPELDVCPYYIKEAPAQKGHWRSLFPKEQSLHVELGCGKGVSTAQMAFDQPTVNFVALDINVDVLAVTRRNVALRYGEHPVCNLLLTTQECERIREAFSEEDRVERIYISFCNPWAEREKHKKRRLTHPRQLIQYRAFLVDGGEIWFKTDDDALFEDSVEYFKMTGFEIRFLTRDLHASGFEPNYVSEHEQKFTDQGIPTKALIAVKRELTVIPELAKKEIEAQGDEADHTVLY